MNARQRYINALKGIDEAKQLLETEEDADMKEMAREELSANETPHPRTRRGDQTPPHPCRP